MKTIISVLCVMLALGALGQNKDFGIWTSGTFQYKYSKQLDFAITPELRWDRNVTRWRTRLLDFKAKYEFYNDWAAIGVIRVGGTQRNSGWQGRTRFQLGVNYKKKVNEFWFSGTSRVQRGRTEETATREADLNNNWRNKIEATYKGLKRVDLSLSLELFHSLMKIDRMKLTDYRWVLEGEYKISKSNFVGLGYLIQNEFQAGLDNRDRVLLFSYKHVMRKNDK